MPAARPESTKPAQRIQHLLELLHRGHAIDKDLLARKFKVTERTIERDLKKYFTHSAAGWELAPAATDVLSTAQLHSYAAFTGMADLFPDDSTRYLLAQLAIPANRRAIQVYPIAHEDLRQEAPQFAQLQAAIQQQHECYFIYKSKLRRAQPYRLINKSGVWYLAAEEAGRLKNFSVSLIDSLQVDENSRFTPDKKHHDYIDKNNDVWFTENTTEVLLRVSTEAAHYFVRRPLLPKQQQRVDGDGSLLVTTHINHPNQLLPVVRHWLPHVRIVEPKAWHQELVQGLHDALARWGELDTPATAQT